MVDHGREKSVTKKSKAAQDTVQVEAPSLGASREELLGSSASFEDGCWHQDKVLSLDNSIQQGVGCASVASSMSVDDA